MGSEMCIRDSDDTPEWPSGLDLVKRESLSVLSDLIAKTVEAAPVANFKKEESAQAQ